MNTMPFSRPIVLTFILCLALASLTATEAAGASNRTVRVEPSGTDEIFANPGMGWQTFHHFADEDRNLAGLPSGSAYFRFYWREVESAAGEIDFALFDQLLAHSRKAGQKLAFRIMCTGSGKYMDVPAYLKSKGCAGTEFKYGSGTCWVPDFSDRLFQEAHFRLIRELGKRYDGHPDLDLLDIGSVGLWGEWHMSDTEDLKTGKPVAVPNLQTRMTIIDEWCRAFPRTSKVILVGSEEGMTRAAQEGFGWRADCLGDMGGFSKTWNHMDNYYLQQIDKTGASNAWKKGPVAFESCWDMRKWKDAGWNIRHIFDYGLRCHASYMNNKSAPIPEGTRAEVEHFLRKLGYRLAVRGFEHPSSAQPGSRVELRIAWENLGVAPPYRDYRVALRLQRKRDTGAAANNLSECLVTEESCQGWLPGRHDSSLRLRLPAKLESGRYEMALGLVAPDTREPAVRLAISPREASGWHPISEMTIGK